MHFLRRSRWVQWVLEDSVALEHQAQFCRPTVTSASRGSSAASIVADAVSSQLSCSSCCSQVFPYTSAVSTFPLKPAFTSAVPTYRIKYFKHVVARALYLKEVSKEIVVSQESVNIKLGVFFIYLQKLISIFTYSRIVLKRESERYRKSKNHVNVFVL